MSQKTMSVHQKPFRQRLVRDMKLNGAVYLMLLPVLVYFIIYHYLPMVGLAAAFENYKIRLGYFHSKFIGLDNFKRFFNSIYAWRLIRNTFSISIKDIVLSYPLTIGFALLLNEVRSRPYKKLVQTISYLPYFISMVVVCGMVRDFSKVGGILSIAVSWFTGKEISLLSSAQHFQGVYITAGIWQGLGYGTIIYLSAMSAISPELYEAAKVDGAGRFRQTWHITLPGILPTVIIMLILRMGSIMSVSYQKIILLYSPSVYETADVISSYVYRVGLAEGAEYGFSTAVGLFQSVVNLVLIIAANKISARVTETSLW